MASNMTQELSAFASTSPVGGEKCPVCLRRLRNSRLGKPENCDHYFCFTCIHEWAKNVNTCPVDRIKFNSIEVYSCIQGNLLDKVYIPNSNVIELSTDPNDVTYCEICHQCDREDTLLLCDGCDRGYHLSCLTPPLDDIPEGDWYCCLCLPIIHAQYDPSLVLESDFEDNHQNLNSHSDDDSSINVVDSDSDDSGMEWRPARSRNQLVMIKESSESSEDDKSTNQDSDDNSSDDEDTFHRRQASSKVTISTSTEGSESESASDIDVVSIGECSSRSHSHSKESVELEVQSGGSSEEGESDLAEDVQPIGKRSKSSQRIESDSDSGDSSENFDPRETGDDSEDIQLIGNRLKRCKNSQRIESDSNSDSNDPNVNFHSREPGATIAVGESISSSKSSSVTWKNTTIPLTRLKWKIPRKTSVSDGTSSDFANHDDTTDQSSTAEFYDGGAKKSLRSEAVVKLEPGMETRQRRAEDWAVYSDLHVLDDISTTSLPNTSRPNTNMITVSETLPTSGTTQPNTESRKSRLYTEDLAAGPSTSHIRSDVKDKWSFPTSGTTQPNTESRKSWLHTAAGPSNDCHAYTSSDVQSKQSFPTSQMNQANLELRKSRLHTEDLAAGPTCSTSGHASSDVHEASDGDDSRQSKKRCHRRRRSKRNKRKEQLADCPNSQKVETWFDFRGIETHLTTRRHSSNTRQHPQVHVAQNGPYYGASEPPWLDTLAYNRHRYDQPMSTTSHTILERPPLLPSPPCPPLSPPLMNFVPNTLYNYPSYPLYAYPPPPIPRVPPPQPPLLTRSNKSVTVWKVSAAPPQPLLSRNLETSDVMGACDGNPIVTAVHRSYVEIQEPKRKKPNQHQRRKKKKKKKAKLVLTVSKKSPKKSEESSVPVSKGVLGKRRRRSQRKKRKREEWKVKKQALKEAGQWPRPKRRKDMLSPGSPKDPTYSPSKWDPKAVAQSDGCMTRARTAATNTPRKQAMREAVREAYRHEDHGEGLRFAREILAKQGRSSDTGSSHKTTGGAVENGMGNENLTTPIRGGSEHPSSTPQSGYVEKSLRSGSSTGGQPRHPVASIPETPPSTTSAQYGNQTRLIADSDVAGPSTSSYRSREREQEHCMRIMDEVKRRTIPSRRTLSSVLVTPVQRAIVTRSVDSEGHDEHVKPVQSQGRGRGSSSDLINQLCQNLDDLQNRNNVIQRDGSIVPIKEGNTSPPPPIDPLLSLTSNTPSPRMASSTSPATTPQRRHRSCDQHPTPAAHLTNQNHTTSTATSSTSGKRRVWVTPEKWRERCSSSCTSADSRSNPPSPCVVRSSQEGRRSRVVKRLLSSDSESGRDNGLPDYVTFVPESPTSNQSPFFYSNTSTTATATACTASMSSDSSGISSNSSAACVSSTIARDGSSSSSRNTDPVSSDFGVDDPKRYVRWLLKQHYHLGKISSYQFSRILERASRKVEQGQSMSNCVDKLRVRRLVDDYVEAYIKAANAE